MNRKRNPFQEKAVIRVVEDEEEEAEDEDGEDEDNDGDEDDNCSLTYREDGERVEQRTGVRLDGERSGEGKVRVEDKGQGQGQGQEGSVQKRRRKRRKPGEVDAVPVPVPHFELVTRCCVKKKCFSKISDKLQKESFDRFYSINNKVHQNLFLVSLMSYFGIKRTRIRGERQRFKNLTWYYYIDSRGTKHSVCKSFFKGLFNVKEKRLRVLQDKLCNGKSMEDMRGRYKANLERKKKAITSRVKTRAKGVQTKEVADDRDAAVEGQAPKDPTSGHELAFLPVSFVVPFEADHVEDDGPHEQVAHFSNYCSEFGLTAGHSFEPFA